MPNRRTYPIGALRDYLVQCQEWLCVTPGPKRRRKWDRSNHCWYHPRPMPARPAPAAPPVRWFERRRPPWPGRPHLWPDAPTRSTYSAADWVKGPDGGLVACVLAPRNMGRWFLWRGVAYRGLVTEPAGLVWPTEHLARSLGGAAVPIRDGRMLVAIAATAVR